MQPTPDLETKQENSIKQKLDFKEINVPVDMCAGVLAIAFSLIILVLMPIQTKVMPSEVITGRMFPTLLMYLMMFCGTILLLQQGYKLLKGQKLKTKKINLYTEVRALSIILIMLVFFLLCNVPISIGGINFGFLLGAIACSIGYLLFFGSRKKSYYIITITLAVAIWAIFQFGLGVNF